MNTILTRVPLAGLASLVCACTTVPLAPRAEAVRLTRNAADVAACRAVGNVRVPDETPPPYTNVEREARNLTVGLGGNTLFVTIESGGLVIQGVAYQCL